MALDRTIREEPAFNRERYDRARSPQVPTNHWLSTTPLALFVAS